ncbi:unnamed protein product [Rotaria socialis]
MRTCRCTLDSRSFLSDNESRHTLPSTSSVNSSLLPLSAAAAAAATTTVVTPGDLTGLPLLKSNVWEYFERCINVTRLKAKCLLCAEELLTPNYRTSNLKRHLAQRHNLKQFGSILSSRSSTTTVILSKIEKKSCDHIKNIKKAAKDSRLMQQELSKSVELTSNRPISSSSANSQLDEVDDASPTSMPTSHTEFQIVVNQSMQANKRRLASQSQNNHPVKRSCI